MVHKNIAITKFENLIKMQLANGADMGDQYLSDKSLKEFARILAKIIKDDIYIYQEEIQRA